MKFIKVDSILIWAVAVLIGIVATMSFGIGEPKNGADRMDISYSNAAFKRGKH